MNEQPRIADAQQARTRSALYTLFAFLFAYPDQDLVAAIRGGEVARCMTALCSALDSEPPLQPEPDTAALSDAGGSDEDLAVEYTRLFDTGPIPLYGGLNHGTRMQVMEEVLRFFEHFGLAPNTQLNELPDHLVSELEFMHFLCHREADALETGGDADPYRRAQRDFLARQLGRWAPQLHPRLVEQSALAFFLEVTRLLAAFLASETRLLQIATGATVIRETAARSTRTIHAVQAI
ncbi:putative ethylbenzene dehydrogenase-like delta-subunit [Sterolibacterium denitrificans]|uniref:Putative ethylbenzene dehydrogenase-like delta-subunit n=1 Tax=Sterolibacterium denitrificans TaxID=157592 RepID=H9NNB0_9PROT|nr:molecular chaperone TorD family protein [Sterolibacterium denitrificans]AFF61346.1 putative ethylbenzene dehydrogenase-like delta-subunit [Sterolibacterium denitrificans]SMB23155.1 putative ethylbenzene dehydrogenase-like delta-subunit [Sterolibacterium denitrificans]